MKKQYLCIGLMLLFLGYSFSSYAQSEVTVTRPFDEEKLKSVSKARFIALSNTALSIGTGLAAVAMFENNTVKKAGAILAAYGVLVAPSTGNFYAEDYPRGLAGAGIRAVGAFLMIEATSEVFGREFADELNVDNKEVSLTDTKVLIGEALIIGSLVYNVLSTEASVKAYNANQGFALNVNSTVVNDRVAPVLTASFNF